MKISGLCISHEHEACPEFLFTDAGKKFRCTCGCHVDLTAIGNEAEQEDKDFYEYE